MGRKWGQHFLRDPRTARRLVSAAGVERGDVVLEVGPGTGRLTRALLELAGSVLAVEVDPQLAAELPGRIGEPERLTVIEGDAASLDLEALLAPVARGRPVRAVANLPYNVATAILDRLLRLRSRLAGIAVLVQREVAERIVASPGSRTYGYLSVLCQDLTEPRIVCRLGPGAFQPPPRVQSAFVRLAIRPRPVHGDLDEGGFLDLVGRMFLTRRKTILNNLQAATGRDRDAAGALLERAGLETRLRPENLAVADWVRLAREVAGGEAGTAL